jgi:peptidoglycan/LPS O-acetylase OafA/YrhL
MPTRIKALEGIRGYAVFLVFLVHHHTLFGGYLPSQAPAFQISRFSHTVGNSGVDLFFVLSGFLIYGNLITKGGSYITFVKKRLRRIYPTFFTVFCLYFVGAKFMSIERLPQRVSHEFVYLLQNLLFMPGIFNIEPLVTVAWSLSYEFFFYLSIPLTIKVTHMRRWRRSARVTFFISFILLHWLGCALGILPHIRLSFFVAGILLFEIVDGAATVGRLSSAGECVMIAFYLGVLAIVGVLGAGQLSVYRRTSLTWTSLLCVSLVSIVMYSIRFPGLLSRIFCSAPLRWLGNMSYSYFLIHGLALNGIAFVLSRLMSRTSLSVGLFLLLMALNFILTLIVGRVLFRYIEWPCSLAPGTDRLFAPAAAWSEDNDARHKTAGMGVL